METVRFGRRSRAAENSSAYRPDVDGLRGVSIIVVILYHASIWPFTGGYIGVDVFFVISGFLITRRLMNDLATGRFSFMRFYVGRVRRLLPVYGVVSATTLIFGYLILIPNDFVLFCATLLSSYLFASNIFFASMSGGYFLPRMEEFPLLHTWSLAVEEQFYFIWPALLLLLHRLKWRSALAIALTAIFLGSFAISCAAAGHNVSAYFLIQYRAFELVIGAALNLPTIRNWTVPAFVTTTCGISGLGLVLGSALILTRFSPFPGLYALVPAVGAAMVIFAGRDRNAATRLLALRPMVWGGLLSYSMYLWHWPILAYLRYLHVPLTPLTVLLGVVGPTLVLSIISWHFVENRFRKQSLLADRPTLATFYVLPTALVGCISFGVWVTNGLPQRFDRDIQELASSYSYETDLARNCSIRDEDFKPITLVYLISKCRFDPSNDKRPNVLLMGDSHANHLKAFFEVLTEQAGTSGVYHVHGGCNVADGLGSFDKDDSQAADRADFVSSCQLGNSQLIGLAEHFDYVVLAGAWSRSKSLDRLQLALQEAVSRITNAGAIPIIVKDVPQSKVDLSKCILRKRMGWPSEPGDCRISPEEFSRTNRVADKIIDDLKSTFPKLRVIDLSPLLCDAQGCVTYIKNTAIYLDGNHLNAAASKMLGSLYQDRFGNPLVEDRGR